ncbi:MAG: hypothetical protein A2506_03760 [Elusimicrobia bacterium RIFOXYD12_FULL_66_9]|nr:MAG: hypothetical protein A2506_03760 [Elusimicrobia bacterium RIFOXYD12_FULL_66_9]
MLELNDLEAFVDRYADRAYWYAFGLSNNEPDAKELVQAAFVKLFDSAGTYDGSQASLENWFLTILRNVHVDFIRRAERRRGVSLDLPILGTDGLTVADRLADTREQALLDRLESQEAGERVQEALKHLSPALRSVAVLVDMEGLRYEEAAKVLGCPLNTVRSRIVRARIELRQHLLDMEVTS